MTNTRYDIARHEDLDCSIVSINGAHVYVRDDIDLESQRRLFDDLGLDVDTIDNIMSDLALS